MILCILGGLMGNPMISNGSPVGSKNVDSITKAGCYRTEDLIILDLDFRWSCMLVIQGYTTVQLAFSKATNKCAIRHYFDYYKTWSGWRLI